jgi:hypothetical protein
MAFSVTVDLSVSIKLGLSFSVKTTGEGFSSNDMPIGSENLAVMEISERDGEAATANESESNDIECEPELMPDAEVRGVETKPKSGREPEMISFANDDVEVRGVEPESEREPELVSFATDLEDRVVEPEPEIFESLADLLASFARARPSNLDNWSGSSSSSNSSPCSPSCLNLIWEEYLVREGRMVESNNGEDEDDEMPLEGNDDVVFLCEVKRV